MFVTALSTKFLMYVQNAQNIKKKKKSVLIVVTWQIYVWKMTHSGFEPQLCNVFAVLFCECFNV